MYEITVGDSFTARHWLRNSDGRCSHPHGHHYRVRVTLLGRRLESDGRLIEVERVSGVLRHVTGYLDGQMVNDLPPFTSVNPSPENLARYVYHELDKLLAVSVDGGIRVKQVMLAEDETEATYYE